jgi:2-desacetyl-2-hydroxyethyl bacteriochlorophyllide A dehydrogenase
MGHEFGATIIETGPGVTGWEAGDRVVICQRPPCGDCFWCRRHEPDLCHHHDRVTRMRATPNVTGSSGYGPLTKWTVDRLMRLPDTLNERQAASIEPATVAFHAVRNSQMRAGDTIAIVGCGPIGLFVLQHARAAGAGRVFVVEPVKGRAEIALKLGADAWMRPEERHRIVDATGAGPDVVFDAAGASGTLQQAVELVKPGGQVMMVGYALNKLDIEPALWARKRVNVRGSMIYCKEDYVDTIRLLERGAVDVDAMISEIVPGSRAPEAFERLLTPTTEIKIMIDPHL